VNSDRFVDMAPEAIVATLLDDGQRICSARTMYRVLAANRQVRERRNQVRHPRYTAPQLLAVRSNEVWSWDITKLLGPEKWTYFYLYVMMDIFSRYVVGWLLASRESQELASSLMTETCEKQDVKPDQLTIHSDRGGPMTAKPVAHLLADMGVTKSHSRPHVSNDNPFSEAHFKTMKYRPEFPKRFGSLQDARSFSRRFFDWYNKHHRHSGIAMMTPEDVHYGRATEVQERRQRVLDAAYAVNPERFVKGPPVSKMVPTAVWINPPSQVQEIDTSFDHGHAREVATLI
jgi:putative transposase